MKKIIAIAVLILAASKAQAQIVNTQSVNQVLSSTMVCAPVSISTMGATGGPTDIVGAVTPYAYSRVTVQNMEGSALLFVGGITVSTSTTAGIPGAGVRGFKIAAGGADKEFLIKPGMKLYAVCSAASGVCDAEVCKAR